MAPVTDKATLEVAPKRTLQDISNDDESDEGFVSPSVQRIGLKNRKESLIRQPDSESSSNSSASDNDSQADSSSAASSTPSSQTLQEISDEDMVVEESKPTAANSVKNNVIKTEGASNNNVNKTDGASNNNVNKTDGASNKDTSEGVRNRETSSVSSSSVSSSDVRKEVVESKAESLAKFIVYTLLGKVNGESSDNVERTLLKCVQTMSSKHEILFKGMMKRVKVTRETGYVSFVTVANTLFEDERMVITWSRIVALYAFGGQLALHCKEKNMEDFACTISEYLGKYAREVLTPFVMSIGGWNKICEEFPEEPDMENKVRKVLSMTAVGLGIAATVTYLTSR